MRNTGTTGHPVSHQTVKLARGKHVSPDNGLCVMELASMLAGEPFSDHPVSVCPVIGAFLRAYNDSVDDSRRQDLYEYAAKVVGTRSTIAVEHQRADMCRRWARQVKLSDRAAVALIGPSREPGRLQRGLRGYWQRPEYAGHGAAITFRRRTRDRNGDELDGLHQAALRLVDELTTVGGRNELQLDHFAIPDKTERPRACQRLRMSDSQGGPGA